MPVILQRTANPILQGLFAYSVGGGQARVQEAIEKQRQKELRNAQIISALQNASGQISSHISKTQNREDSQKHDLLKMSKAFEYDQQGADAAAIRQATRDERLFKYDEELRGADRTWRGRMAERGHEMDLEKVGVEQDFRRGERVAEHDFTRERDLQEARGNYEGAAAEYSDKLDSFFEAIQSGDTAAIKRVALPGVGEWALDDLDRWYGGKTGASMGDAQRQEMWDQIVEASYQASQRATEEELDRQGYQLVEGPQYEKMMNRYTTGMQHINREEALLKAGGKGATMSWDDVQQGRAVMKSYKRGMTKTLRPKPPEQPTNAQLVNEGWTSSPIPMPPAQPGQPQPEQHYNPPMFTSKDRYGAIKVEYNAAEQFDRNVDKWTTEFGSAFLDNQDQHRYNYYASVTPNPEEKSYWWKQAARSKFLKQKAYSEVAQELGVSPDSLRVGALDSMDALTGGSARGSKVVQEVAKKHDNWIKTRNEILEPQAGKINLGTMNVEQLQDLEEGFRIAEQKAQAAGIRLTDAEYALADAVARELENR